MYLRFILIVEPGQPEVSKFDLAFVVQENVGAFYVSKIFYFNFYDLFNIFKFF